MRLFGAKAFDVEMIINEQVKSTVAYELKKKCFVAIVLVGASSKCINDDGVSAGWSYKENLEYEI
jgi:hypothetical protein